MITIAMMLIMMMLMLVELSVAIIVIATIPNVVMNRPAMIAAVPGLFSFEKLAKEPLFADLLVPETPPLANAILDVLLDILIS
jgi:hypothetical protein